MCVEVTLDKSRGLCIFSMGNEAKIINLEQDYFVHYRTVSAVKRVEFVDDRISHSSERSLVYYHCSECACVK
jgi:hypothetical protein